MTNSTSYDCVPLNGNSYYQLFIYPCSAGKSDNFPIPIPMIASLYIHVFLGKGVAPQEPQTMNCNFATFNLSCHLYCFLL